MTAKGVRRRETLRHQVGIFPTGIYFCSNCFLNHPLDLQFLTVLHTGVQGIRFPRLERSAEGVSAEATCSGQTLSDLVNLLPLFFSDREWNLSTVNSHRRTMETLYYSRLDSPIGPLNLAISEKGLVTLEFDCGHFPPKKNKNLLWEKSPEKTKRFTRELDEYFTGKRRRFSFPLDLRGTPFQVRCWQALLAIPYGETRSYADIARAVGQPQAFRAVGMANNRNPIAIVVPCHRVIASDGTLCGYGGGLDVKRKLLELEGALTRDLVA